MVFVTLIKALSKGKKVRLSHWDKGEHVITEYHGKGIGGGTHLLTWVECKYSHYDEWQPTLEELKSKGWEIYDTSD